MVLRGEVYSNEQGMRVQKSWSLVERTEWQGREGSNHIPLPTRALQKHSLLIFKRNILPTFRRFHFL